MSIHQLRPGTHSNSGIARLFCFPYAGGGASIYRKWLRHLAPNIDLYPVQLPGRETRFREPLCDDLVALARGLAEELIPFLDKPYAVLGHSMGALVAFECVRYLRRLGEPLPERMFASACKAPHLPIDLGFSPDASDEVLISELRDNAGTPDSVLEHQELLSLVLPRLRADFRAIDSYDFVDDAPLDLPITAIGADADGLVSPAQLHAWREHGTGSFEHIEFPGDHFFIRRRTEELTSLVRARLIGGGPPMYSDATDVKRGYRVAASNGSSI